MKLPEEYDDKTRITPAVTASIVAVVVFVGILLCIVLLFNGLNTQNNVNTSGQNMESAQEVSGYSEQSEYSDTSQFVSGSTLSPDDFDFWDLYPEESIVQEETKVKDVVKNAETEVETDPSTDGKHTLIQYANGEEEWVFVNPYIPVNEYDYTKLVSQSDIMKYYEDGKLTSYVGVDISKYQDYVDFNKVKKAGIDFVMLRVGARGYSSGQLVLDENFQENLKRATDAGLKIGVYFFSQAISEAEVLEEANLVLEQVKDYEIAYPVAYDMEYINNDTSRVENLTKSEKTALAKTFLETIQTAGYIPMIYGNKEWLVKNIEMSKLTSYDVWLSQLQDLPDYPYQYSMWQYSDSGEISGISGNVNMNISFIDYSEK